MTTVNGTGFRLDQQVVTAVKEVILQVLVDVGLVVAGSDGSLSILAADSPFDPTTYVPPGEDGTIGSWVQTCVNAIQDVSVGGNGLGLNTATPGQLVLDVLQNIKTTGNPTFANVILSRLALSGGSVPAGVAGTAAGTAPVTQILGTDALIQFNLTAGTTPAAGQAVIEAFTFSQAFNNIPAVLMIPAGKNAAALQNTANNAVIPAAISKTGFSLLGGVNALTAGAQYSWYFLVIGN